MKGAKPKLEAIIVDPVARSISLVRHAKDLDDVYATLGCDTICATQMPFNHTMFLDDNGLCLPIAEINRRGLFYMDTAKQPFAGKGIIFHSTPDGDLDSCFLLIEQVEELIRWRPKSRPMTEAEKRIVTEIQIIPFGGIKNPNE